MIDAACCRYGNQDIHQLRGVKRLRNHEKTIFTSCVLEHMEAEFQPTDLGITTIESNDNEP